MASFDVEKGGQHQVALPQYPVPVATSHQDSDFPPRYEEALNASLRNFEKLEGQIGKGNVDEAPAPNRSKINWKRYLLVGLPILLFMATAIIAGVVVFRGDHHNHNPAAVTITRRHITTVFETETVYQSTPSSIADAASSFYAESGYITSTSTMYFGAKSIGFSGITTTMTLPRGSMSPTTATTPLPSVNMSPSSTTTPLPSVDMLPSTTASTLITTSAMSSTPTKTADPLGAGCCGLPGSPCLGGRDVSTPNTVTKHTTITIIGHTTTTVSIPASILDAASSYYEQRVSSVLSAVSGSEEDVSTPLMALGSKALPPQVTKTTAPKTSSTFSTATASERTATVPCANMGWYDTGCFMPG